jgi:hypothetical protein
MTYLSILALLTFAGAMAQDQRELIGRWRSAQTSKGGIGAMYEFRGDGSVDFSPGAIVEMNYRVQGDSIIFPSSRSAGPPDKVPMSWQEDDRLCLYLGGSAWEVYERQGDRRDPQNALLGEWLTSRVLDGKQMPVRMIFSPGNKSLLLIAFTTTRGSFTVNGGRVNAAIGSAGLEGPFGLSNGALTIHRSRGDLRLLPY